MSRTKKITLVGLVVVTVVLIAWDLYVYQNDDHTDEISVVWLWLSSHPALPWAFGVLCGHLAWPQYLIKKGG